MLFFSRTRFRALPTKNSTLSPTVFFVAMYYYVRTSYYRTFTCPNTGCSTSGLLYGPCFSCLYVSGCVKLACSGSASTMFTRSCEVVRAFWCLKLYCSCGLFLVRRDQCVKRGLSSMFLRKRTEKLFVGSRQYEGCDSCGRALKAHA